jgi:hypothetical protein
MPGWTLTLALLGCALASACDTYVVLRSRCTADADAKACQDAGAANPKECKDPAECQAGEDCLKGACTTTCPPPDNECDTCPAGTEPRKFASGACVVCKCVPLCKWHDECPQAMACVAGSCTDCALAAACPASCDFGWRAEVVIRNGCKLCECTPPNECSRDADCGPGQLCYPGQQCDDGCTNPGCCHGNLCGVPSCKPTTAISCMLTGCARGTCSGDPACKPGSCKCDLTVGTDTGWVCGPECKASCS